MRSGTIVLDDSFLATDQTQLQKLLVLLKDGLCGFYVATKTTSNGAQYTYAPGCQPEGRFRCFYVPKGWASFRNGDMPFTQVTPRGSMPGLQDYPRTLGESETRLASEQAGRTYLVALR